MSWSEAALMLTSGLLVAAVAVPVGLLARALRPRGEPLLPTWKPWPVPWGGFEVTIAFLVGSFVLPQVMSELLAAGGFFQHVYGPDFPAPRAPDVAPERLKEAATLRVMWAGLFALPLTLGVLYAVYRLAYPKRRPSFVGRGSLAGKVSLAVLAWLALAPVVLVFHAAVNTVAFQFDVVPEQHPFTAFGSRPLHDRVLFVVQACVIAPLWEEVLFRGLLLSWCVGRMRLPGAGVSPPTAWRPWFVMLAAVALVVASGGRAGPLAFAAVLAVGLAVLWRYTRTGARRARAVYATAALFALVHSNVWPSPIPLFALGLGLGYLAVRTNGVLVPAVVHALFNAVSVAFVLRA